MPRQLAGGQLEPTVVIHGDLIHQVGFPGKGFPHGFLRVLTAFAGRKSDVVRLVRHIFSAVDERRVGSTAACQHLHSRAKTL